jgi:hypothetical protein
MLDQFDGHITAEPDLFAPIHRLLVLSLAPIRLLRCRDRTPLSRSKG